MSTKKVGFIGLGAMGLGMASCLVKAEFSVTGFDINQKAMTEFTKSGGRPANTPRDTTTEADVLVIVVATSDQASDVLFNPDSGALAMLPENAVILLCITASPDYILSLESRMKENNRPDVRLIDCPISGGEVRAREGTLSLLCAGKEADIAYIRDVLNCFASHVHIIPGGIGAGSSVKMVHQILVGVHILASVEVMGLAYVAGLDLQPTYDAVIKEDGASWLFGQRAAHILDENRVPASSLMIITKDFAMIEACMRSNKVHIPLASLAYQLFIQASSAGWDDDDCNAVNLYLLDRGTIQSLRKPPRLTKPPLINEADITNLLIGVHTAAAVEVLQFAKRLNLDIDVVKQVVQDAAGSSVMFNKVHSQLREKIEISLKSLNNYESISQRLATAIEDAKPAGYPLFLASAALQQFYNSSEKIRALDVAGKALTDGLIDIGFTLYLTILYTGKRKAEFLKMGVYHIVLFKLKHDYEKPLLEHWKQQVHNLVGVIPGLKYVDVGAPLPATADRAKGYNVSLVAVLEKPEDALVYAEHPEHEKLIRECRPRLFEEVLVCDMPFQER